MGRLHACFWPPQRQLLFHASLQVRSGARGQAKSDAKTRVDPVVEQHWSAASMKRQVLECAAVRATPVLAFVAVWEHSHVQGIPAEAWVQRLHAEGPMKVHQEVDGTVQIALVRFRS